MDGMGYIVGKVWWLQLKAILSEAQVLSGNGLSIYWVEPKKYIQKQNLEVQDQTKNGL